MMAKKVSDEPKPSAGHNGIDPEYAELVIRRFRSLVGDKMSIMGRAMKECRTVQEDIDEMIVEAKSKGIPSKELRAVFKRVLLEDKIEAIRAKMEAESQDNYDRILEALGDLADTPLGRAASSKAPDAPPPAADEERDLRRGKGRGPRTRAANGAGDATAHDASTIGEDGLTDAARTLQEGLKQLPEGEGEAA